MKVTAPDIPPDPNMIYPSLPSPPPPTIPPGPSDPDLPPTLWRSILRCPTRLKYYIDSIILTVIHEILYTLNATNTALSDPSTFSNLSTPRSLDHSLNSEREGSIYLLPRYTPLCLKKIQFVHAHRERYPVNSLWYKVLKFYGVDEGCWWR